MNKFLLASTVLALGFCAQSVLAYENSTEPVSVGVSAEVEYARGLEKVADMDFGKFVMSGHREDGVTVATLSADGVLTPVEGATHSGNAQAAEISFDFELDAEGLIKIGCVDSEAPMGDDGCLIGTSGLGVKKFTFASSDPDLNIDESGNLTGTGTGFTIGADLYVADSTKSLVAENVPTFTVTLDY